MSYWDNSAWQPVAPPQGAAQNGTQTLSPVPQSATDPFKVKRQVRSRPGAARPAGWDYTPSGYTPWGPTTGAAAYDAHTPAAKPAPQRQQGLLETPGAYENWFNQHQGELNATSNTENLYQSGNQGLNTWYDRERDKRQKRLEDQMSAMGVFGSGATARGMFELEAELGAQQAKEMADLAYKADMAKGQRLDRAGNAAGGAQDYFQNRVTAPFNASMNLGTRLSGLVQQFSGASADEQAALRGELINTLIAEAGIDRNAAEQMAEDFLSGLGNLYRAGAGSRSGSGSTTPAVDPDPYGGIGR